MPITCESDRIIMVILYDMGFPTAEIANDLGVNERTVNRWIVRHTETGLIQPNYRGGRPRATTHEEDLNIALTSIEDPFRTASDIQRILNYDISLKTFQR